MAADDEDLIEPRVMKPQCLQKKGDTFRKSGAWASYSECFLADGDLVQLAQNTREASYSCSPG